jgi:hypothetical protein
MWARSGAQARRHEFDLAALEDTALYLRSDAEQFVAPSGGTERSSLPTPTTFAKRHETFSLETDSGVNPHTALGWPNNPG